MTLPTLVYVSDSQVLTIELQEWKYVRIRTDYHTYTPTPSLEHQTTKNVGP
jgi:hypothetical protein